MTEYHVVNGNKAQLLKDYDIDLQLQVDTHAVEDSVRTILRSVGEDPEPTGCSRPPTASPACTRSCSPATTPTPKR